MNNLLQEFTKHLQSKGYIKKEDRGFVGDDTPRINAISEEFIEDKPKWIQIDDVISMLENQTKDYVIQELKWKLLENSGLDNPLDIWDHFDKELMLYAIRKERPLQTIHQVIHIEKNEYGFYDVYVNMESDFMGTKVKNTDAKLPYPLSKFLLLSDSEANKWMIY